MRILALEVEGFGPFRDQQRVVFDEAAASGILLISGRTGSGKSSLLDAISFALYGAVPRYDGQPARVRSDHLEPDQNTTVRLEFEMAGARYRVERRPEWERPKRRGEGTTKQPQEARLWRWDEGSSDWEGLASRPTDVAAELSDIVGLSHVQFLQVVLLAQGGFQKFLHADNQDRQATLRTLFQTGRFDEVEQRLLERRQALSTATERATERLEDQLERLEQGLNAAHLEFASADEDDLSTEAPADDSEETGDAASRAPSYAERREQLAESISRLEQRSRVFTENARRADAEQHEADTRVQRTRVIADRQARLAEAQRLNTALQERRSAIEQDREAFLAATRAAAVQPYADRSRATQTRRDTWKNERLAAVESLVHAAASLLVQIDGVTLDETVDVAALTAGELARQREHISTSLVHLEAAEEVERTLPLLDADLEQLERTIAVAASEAERLRERAAALPKQLADSRESLAQLNQVAALAPQRREGVTRAEAVLSATQQLEDIAPKLADAQAVTLERAGESMRASNEVHSLVEQRVRGMAGELAESLAPGNPCPVCGSHEHPSPAQRDDRVSGEAVAKAVEREQLAREAREAALAHERDLEAEIAALTIRAEDATTEDAEAGLRDAQRALTEAEEAAAQLPDARQLIEQLEHEFETVTEEERKARDTSLTARSEARTLETTIAERRTELARMRGDYPSISARISAETAVRSAIDLVRECSEQLRTGQLAYDEAQVELQAALAQQGFDTAKEARRAALPQAARDELQQQIETYDAERIRIDAALHDPELQNLPDQPVPLAEHEDTCRAAREHAQAAQVAANALDRALRDCTQQLKQVDRELIASSEAHEKLLKLRRLVDTVQGKDPNTRKMRLEVFLLAARLEAIVAAANRRLERMVGGRYSLEHDDSLRSRGRQSGLGLRVMDAYTGRHRSTASLSGGETFLVSLTLALGLADVVSAEAGGIALDTLFIDEGFGSLDPDALDEAMATLDGLREGGRSVILISHVAEMKERIPAKLEVTVNGNGTSSLQGAGVPAGRI